VTADRQARARKLANVPLLFLPSSSALLRTDSGWESIGAHELVGALPN